MAAYARVVDSSSYRTLAWAGTALQAIALIWHRRLGRIRQRDEPGLSIRPAGSPSAGDAGLAQDATVDLVVADDADQLAVLHQSERVAGLVADLERGP